MHRADDGIAIGSAGRTGAPKETAMTELGDRAVGELLSDEQLRRIDAYWRAANYLCVGLIYLRENPLLREPLAASHIKAMLLGHSDTAPGQNFIDARLNPVIPVRDLDLIYLSGREHGAAALVANTYLEGTYRKLYPQIAQYEAGPKRLIRQFSCPGGIPGHVSPQCPGSIHEGGERGDSLSHACGPVLDNAGLIAAYAAFARAAHGRQIPRQRRNAAARFAPDGLPRLRAGGERAGRGSGLRYRPARDLPARCHPHEPQQLPPVRPR